MRPVHSTPRDPAKAARFYHFELSFYNSSTLDICLLFATLPTLVNLRSLKVITAHRASLPEWRQAFILSWSVALQGLTKLRLILHVSTVDTFALEHAILPFLQVFNISLVSSPWEYNQLDPNVTQYRNTTISSFILRHAETLQSLSLAFHGRRHSRLDISELIKKLRGLDKLRSIEIQGYIIAHGEGLRNELRLFLLALSPSLQSININDKSMRNRASRAPDIPPPLILSSSTSQVHSPNLTELYIDIHVEFSDTFSSFICTHLRSLNTLSLTDALVDVETANRFVEMVSKLTGKPRLQRLSLYIPVKRPALMILSDLLKLLPYLEVLNILLCGLGDGEGEIALVRPTSRSALMYELNRSSTSRSASSSNLWIQTLHPMSRM
jgi:hypothetical protein